MDLRLKLWKRFIHRSLERDCYGYAPPLILEQAIKFGVLEKLLQARSATAEILCASCGMSLRGGILLLDGLVAMGYVRKSGETYRPNKHAIEYVLALRDNEVDAMIRKTGLATAYYRLQSKLCAKWLKLGDAVASGRPAHAYNNELEGTAYFVEFAEAMFANSLRTADYFAKKYRARQWIEATQTPAFDVLDVGAGSAAWSLPWALASQKTRVTAVDWKGVLSVAERIVACLGMSHAYDFVAADTLELNYHAKYDLALLGHVIHTEGEARSRALLKRCYDALRPGGKIVIAEWVPNDERNGPNHVLIYGLTMLLSSENGGTYSFKEMSAWLRDCGFVRPRTFDIPGPSPLVLAEKP